MPADVAKNKLAHRVWLSASALMVLKGAGLQFVAAVWGEYEGWRAAELALLREAGMLVDQLETLRGQPAERTAQRTLLSVLAALGLER